MWASLWTLGIPSDIMSFQAQEMTQTMREENSTYSFLNEFFHWEFVNDPNLNQVFNDDFFSYQMHIFPVDTRL
jgi:hypothetical protein